VANRPMPSTSPAESAHDHFFATLVHLHRRARQAQSCAELDFIAVNETHELAPYRQAALWLEGEGVTTLSGVATPEANAPYVQWLNRLLRRLAQQNSPHPCPVDRTQLSDEDMREWNEWLPAFGIWVPVPAQRHRFQGGGWLFARDLPWTADDLAMLEDWAEEWSHARAARQPNKFLALLRTRPADTQPPDKTLKSNQAGRVIRAIVMRRATWIIALLIAAAFIPVKLTVLAPGELVPLNPSVVRAPLDGVVERILVSPNQSVRTNDPLFEFDRTNLQNQLNIAQQTLATALADYRQKAQLSLMDPSNKAQLAILQGQIAERSAEVTYLTKLNERAMVAADRDGIVLFNDPTEWAGRPVVTGERVMVIANEHEAELEAWLAPADAIDLQSHAPVTFYLNASPLEPLRATLHYVAPQATERPDGSFAYRVRASLASSVQPRIGLKGTAKLQGETVSLWYWILRRPIGAARAMLGT